MKPKNPVSADLWHEEQRAAERARLAARIVGDAAVVLKNCDMTEADLLAALGAIGEGRVVNYSALYSEDGKVDVCNFRLCGVRLTESEIGEALCGLGSTKTLDCVFEDGSLS
jgi:hypothetical protein